MTVPCTASQVIDLYFLEHRAKLLDVAAYLDRVDRASADTGVDDFRHDAMQKAVQILTEDGPDRAKRILLLLSDLSEAMPQSADGMKGASGAVPVAST